MQKPAALLAAFVLLAASPTLTTAQTAAQTTPRANCRQALALGLDVSGSVDSREYRLQIDGLAGALSDRDVQDALLAMPSAPVNLLIYEWSGPDDQHIVLNWRAIDSQNALNAVIAQLRQTNRAPASPSTAIGAALATGIALLNQRKACWKRTLDISGDGKSNTGPHPRDLSHSRLTAQITINALVIGVDTQLDGDRRQIEISELSSYFDAYVIAGPDAFVETALGFEDYEAAMVRKLKRELEGLALSQLGFPASVRKTVLHQ